MGSILRRLHCWLSLDHLRQDVRYALRGVRREPAFASAAILTLAVGIAAATTVFSVVHAELWKPLPFRDVDRLVDIGTTAPGPRASYDPVSGPDFREWQARNETLEELAGYLGSSRRVLRGRAAPEFVRVKAVTPNFFSVLQARAAIGQAFDRGDRVTAVLTDAAWQRLFGGSGEIVGQPIVVDDQTYTVAGVMPAGARAGVHRRSRHLRASRLLVGWAPGPGQARHLRCRPSQAWRDARRGDG
jgi:hypothetical protein